MTSTAPPTPQTPQAPQRRRRRWPVVVLAVVAVVVVVPLLAGGVFLWSFSGGWDGIRPKAQLTDPEVISAREDSAERTTALHDATVRQVLDAAGGTVLATTEVDMCTEGQNNWKIHDGYTLSCSRTAATAVQLPGDASVEGATRSVEEALLAQGWQTLSATRVQPDGSEAVARYRGQTPDSSLEVGVSTQDYPPIYLPSPEFADWSDGSGSGADVEAAFAAGTGVRLLVVNEVTYFED